MYFQHLSTDMKFNTGFNIWYVSIVFIPFLSKQQTTSYIYIYLACVNSLTRWEISMEFCLDNFQAYVSDWWWRYHLWIVLRWISLDLSDDKSTLVQVMAWCRQAPSHYLSHCWPRSLSPYGVIRPQWVNPCGAETTIFQTNLGKYHSYCCSGSLYLDGLVQERRNSRAFSNGVTSFKPIDIFSVWYGYACLAREAISTTCAMFPHRRMIWNSNLS